MEKGKITIREVRPEDHEQLHKVIKQTTKHSIRRSFDYNGPDALTGEDVFGHEDVYPDLERAIYMTPDENICLVAHHEDEGVVGYAFLDKGKMSFGRSVLKSGFAKDYLAGKHGKRLKTLGKLIKTSKGAKSMKPPEEHAVISIGVKEGFYHAGLGSQMLEDLESRAKSDGVTKFAARIAGGNVRSQNFFEKNRYKRHKTGRFINQEGHVYVKDSSEAYSSESSS